MICLACERNPPRDDSELTFSTLIAFEKNSESVAFFKEKDFVSRLLRLSVKFSTPILYIFVLQKVKIK